MNRYFILLLCLLGALPAWGEISISGTNRSLASRCVGLGDGRGQFNIEQFRYLEEMVSIGTRGARLRGFHQEIDVRKADARVLNDLLHQNHRGKDILQAVRQLSKPLRLDFERAKSWGKKLGKSFDMEGDIVEVLGAAEISQRYPESEYLIISGVNYQDYRGRQFGELDLVVFRRADCQAVLVGEAKLGLGSAYAAREQLERFAEFLARESRNWKEPIQIPFNPWVGSPWENSNCKLELFGEALAF